MGFFDFLKKRTNLDIFEQCVYNLKAPSARTMFFKILKSMRQLNEELASMPWARKSKNLMVAVRLANEEEREICEGIADRLDETATAIAMAQAKIERVESKSIPGWKQVEVPNEIKKLLNTTRIDFQQKGKTIKKGLKS